MLLLIIISLINAIVCREFAYSNCGNEEYIRFNKIILDSYPIKYPGSVNLSIDMDILKDIPGDNLMAVMSGDKLTPIKLHLPCFWGFGSCTLTYCQFWKDIYADLSNPTVPDCPTQVGHYFYDRANVLLPDLGYFNMFYIMAQGDYAGNVTFVDSKTNEVYGCTHVQFTFESRRRKPQSDMLH